MAIYKDDRGVEPALTQNNTSGQSGIWTQVTALKSNATGPLGHRASSAILLFYLKSFVFLSLLLSFSLLTHFVKEKKTNMINTVIYGLPSCFENWP